jgi:hypothetical protein
MAMTPAPVTVVPMMAPAYFLRLEAVDFAFGRNGRTEVLVRRRKPFISTKQLGRQRRGPGNRGKGGSARRKSNSEFQKVAALHDIFLSCSAGDARRF